MRARDDALPLLLVDGKIVSQGSYPERGVLAELAGIALPESIHTEAVQELVAIGAAIVANCEPCFRNHFDKARKLGVSKEVTACPPGRDPGPIASRVDATRHKSPQRRPLP